jgi:hypothetical protein
MVDGHCAADAETIYVGTLGTVTCSESNSGTLQAPVCSVQNGVSLAKSGGKAVVVVRGTLTAATTNIAASAPLTIVGRSTSAVLTAAAGGDCLTITAGEIHLRNLTIQGGTSTGMGINAAPTGGNTVTLDMDTCAIINNPGGGILLNGAAFDIRNTSITGNGPGTIIATGLVWGGIKVDSQPPSGSTTSLNLVTITNNKQIGLSCAGGITGVGVFATGSAGGIDIGSTCGVTACTPASTTCGTQAQPQ